jgi:hypothetical protein
MVDAEVDPVLSYCLCNGALRTRSCARFGSLRIPVPGVDRDLVDSYGDWFAEHIFSGQEKP